MLLWMSVGGLVFDAKYQSCGEIRLLSHSTIERKRRLHLTAMTAKSCHCVHLLQGLHHSLDKTTLASVGRLQGKRLDPASYALTFGGFAKDSISTVPRGPTILSSSWLCHAWPSVVVLRHSFCTTKESVFAPDLGLDSFCACPAPILFCAACGFGDMLPRSATT